MILAGARGEGCGLFKKSRRRKKDLDEEALNELKASSRKQSNGSRTSEEGQLGKS